MRFVLLLITTIVSGYFLWSCKVRLGESSTIAASEADLAEMDGTDCRSASGEYPIITGVTLDPEHAALRFTLEDKGANGSTFKYRYFTHATKYYDPAKDIKYYAVKLGDNLLDFSARGQKVEKIYYKPSGNAVELSCK